MSIRKDVFLDKKEKEKKDGSKIETSQNSKSRFCG